MRKRSSGEGRQLTLGESEISVGGDPQATKRLRDARIERVKEKGEAKDHGERLGGRK